MAKVEPNLFFSHLRRNKEVFEGNILQDARYKDWESPIPSLILGGFARGWVEPGGAKIPVDFDNPPSLDLRSGKALRGSIVEVEVEILGADGQPVKRKRRKLAEYNENGVNYLHLVTGLVGQGSGVMADRMALLSELKGGKAFPHGSFSLDDGATKVVAGEGEGLDLPSDVVATVKAERVRWGRSQRFLDGAPVYIHSEWRMPWDSQVLAMEIDGRLYRYVSSKLGIARVDANGLERTYKLLEEKRRADREAERKARETENELL
ncbi:MAG TPA: hypothetical protein VNM40_01630 [Candidatus Paceibacterota bacterium]|nr:hypothetical protein [Candidatus Paceibacterota bacterium]